MEARAREVGEGRDAELAGLRQLVRQAEEHAGAYKRERDQLLRRLTAIEVEHSTASQRLGEAQRLARRLHELDQVLRPTRPEGGCHPTEQRLSPLGAEAASLTQAEVATLREQRL